ncbi:Gyp1p [Rhizophagus irregularis DAOM 197198w]|uniref:Gyp1p n=1 Tax=Rhizophagus irregularis (strain DAOM 197198w) TaxID=1432141 RepID=A0A015JK42_RHIIW|nr:Gyp1p [Rhizophagus irregularis DAOM 197198w]
MDYKERLTQFEDILNTKNIDTEPTIDLYKFRHLCFRGIPDKPGIRQLSWKILLGYLPPDKRKWQSVLEEQRSTYYSFVRDLLADPSEEELKNPDVSSDDHPLNSSPNSKWAEYFADNSILEQIDKDVRRTLPDLAFFQLPVPHSPLSPLSPKLEAINRMNGARSPSLLETLDINDDSTSISNYSDSTLTIHSELDAEVAALEAQLSIISQPSSQFTSGNLYKGFSSMCSPKPIPLDLYSNRPSSPPPQPAVTPIPTRRSIFKRVQHLNKDFGVRGNSANTRPCSPASIDLHWEAIERILFIYAKLNPGVGYVQGMNEILGPIYYTMANDSDEEGKAHAEADSFFVFTLLMSFIRDHFVRSLDTDEATGIGHTMKKLNRRLKTYAPDLWRDLERKSLYPTYYSFRWITVMLTQEFALPDVIRLWDSILSDRDDDFESTGGFEFLLDFCCAMLMCVKDELLTGSFSDNVKLLQNYPIQDPATVLRKAYSLRELRLLAKLNDEEDDELDEYSLTNFKGEDFNYYSSSGNEYYDNNDPSPGDSILETSGCFPVETTNTKFYNIRQRTSNNNHHLLRTQEVKVKGLAMLRKVQGVVSGRTSLNNFSTSRSSTTTYLRPNITKSNILSLQSKTTNNGLTSGLSLPTNYTNNKVNITNGMSGFANRLSNVWKKNITYTT